MGLTPSKGGGGLGYFSEYTKRGGILGGPKKGSKNGVFWGPPNSKKNPQKSFSRPHQPQKYFSKKKISGGPSDGSTHLIIEDYNWKTTDFIPVRELLDTRVVVCSYT